jgi:CHAD domain-containing protein
VLLSYLGQQVEALKKHDPGVRMDAPDAVHQLRVAARRIRSVLATFRKLTDRDVARTLRSELKWLAASVGAARDNEVMRARLLDLIGAEPPDLLLGPVSRQIEEHFEAVARNARAKGLAALKSARYFRLLDSLDAFLTEPPLTKSARKDAPQAVGRLVSKERKRLKKHVLALDEDSASPAIDVSLHEIRKSAKRLRYAAEASSAVFGKPATALARTAEEIQEILGDQHDSVVTRDTLRELAVNHRGKSVFTYGRLHALEQVAGEESRERFFRTWQESPPQPLRWK